MHRLVFCLLISLLCLNSALAQSHPGRLIADFASGQAKGDLHVQLEAVTFHDREDDGYHLEFTKRGVSAVRAHFRLHDFPEDCRLVLVNRSTVIGQSMADVVVNGQTVVRDFDPRTREFVKSEFPIGQALRRGDNEITVVLSQGSMKMYWLKAMIVRITHGHPGGGSNEDDLFAVERIQRMASILNDAFKSTNARIEAGRKIAELGMSGPMAREAAAQALGGVFDVLSSSSIQQMAIEGLARVRGPKAARQLGKLINNAMASTSIRITAIRALEGFMGYDEREAALQTLAPLFENGLASQSVLSAGIAAVRAVGGESPVLAQVLKPLINNAMASNTSRIEALDALLVVQDRMAAAAAVDAAAPLFENGLISQSMTNKGLEVMEVLGRMVPGEVVDAVAPLMRNAMASTTLRIRAIQVVGRVGRPVRRQAIRLLEELTLNGLCSSSIRQAAQQAINELEL